MSTSNPIQDSSVSGEVQMKSSTDGTNTTATVMDAFDSHIDSSHHSTFAHIKDEEENKSVAAKIYEALASAYLDNIPLDLIKHLSTKNAILFGLIAYCAAGGLFLYFVVSGYKESIKQEFLSLEKDSGVCKDVEMPVTGTFLATETGMWEGNLGFDNSNASFSFVFTDLRATDKTFKAGIEALQTNQLTATGETMQSLNLAYNLLFWMHLSIGFAMNNKLQIFEFTGSPGEVFNREYVAAGLAGAHSYCATKPQRSYAQDYAQMTLEWDYDSYVEDSSCNSTVAPEDLGYIDSYDNGYFSLNLDLVTLTAALAINMNLTDGYLEPTGELVYVGDYNNAPIVLAPKFDPRYAEMQPMWCFEKGVAGVDYITFYVDEPDAGNGDDSVFDLGSGQEDFIDICVLRLGNLLALPALNMYDEGCQSCGQQSSSYCNTIDLLASALFFPDEFENVQLMMELINKYEGDMKALNDVVYGASMKAVHSTTDDSSAFSFCDEECAVLAVNTYDSLDQAVSPYYYNVFVGHCTDSTHKEAFTKLASTPPTKLTQEYFKCRKKHSVAFFESLGIAHGNAALFIPLFCLFVLAPLIKLYYDRVLHKPLNEDKYSQEVIDAATKELAIRLLSMADDSSTLPEGRNSILAQLVSELKLLGEEDEAKKIKERKQL